MHILGNIVIFILLVIVLYKIGSVYLRHKDKDSFEKRLKEELKRQQELKKQDEDK
jgi:hypothetical protein